MSTSFEAVFVIDHDPAARRSMELLLHHAGLTAHTFRSQEEFLDQYDNTQVACLVSELPKDGMKALQTLRTACQAMPIIILTSDADIPTVVAAMRHGVLDFLQKPMDPALLLKTIKDALQMDRERRLREEGIAQIAGRFCQITAREREILDLLITGKSNKQIAAQVGIALKTVQHHRANLMSKTGALNVADLVRLSLNLQAA
jgi:FixJ family two-component response regulator